MTIKDQAAIMEAVRIYLAAKDDYLSRTTPETIDAYEAANVKLRETYQYVYLASRA